MQAPEQRVQNTGTPAGYVALFGVAFALRALVAFEGRDALLLTVPVGDSAVFDEWARRIAAGDVAGQGVLWQAPGAAWLLGLAYSLFGPGLLVGRLLQALLGAATAVLTADLGRRLVGRGTGLAAGWLYALYAPAIFFGLRLGKPAGATFFVVLLAHTLARHGTRPRFGLALGAGLLAAAAALTRENLALLVPVVLLAVGRQAGVRAAGVALVGVLVGLLPLGLRNLSAEVPLHSTTANLGSNLWIGNNDRADGLYVPMVVGHGSPSYERGDAQALAEDDLGRALDGAAVSEYWRLRALDWAEDHPGRASALTATRAWYLVHATEWMDSIAYGPVADGSFWLSALGVPLRFGLLLPLALAGLVLAGARRRLLVWPILVPVVVVLAAHLPFFVFARFRAPILPLLCVPAVLGARGLALRIPGWKRAAWVAVVALVVVHLPTPAGESAASASYSSAGSALRANGREAEARTAFERALDFDSGNALAHFNLGQLLAASGELDAAEPHLVKAIELQGEFELDARLAVVEGLIALGLWDRARLELEPVARLNQLDADTDHRIGRLFRRMGEPARAMTHYRRALLTRPRHGAAANDLGFLLWTHGQWAKAAQAFERALAAQPDLLPALVNLAGLLASCPEGEVRDGQRALELAGRARDSGAPLETALDLEAMALAELGRFEEAARTAERAQEAARRAGHDRLGQEIGRRRALYSAGRAYRSG
jgi:tetratricopeptide (TPR) repeat protein